MPLSSDPLLGGLTDIELKLQPSLLDFWVLNCSPLYSTVTMLRFLLRSWWVLMNLGFVLEVSTFKPNCDFFYLYDSCFWWPSQAHLKELSSWTCPHWSVKRTVEGALMSRINTLRSLSFLRIGEIGFWTYSELSRSRGSKGSLRMTLAILKRLDKVSFVLKWDDGSRRERRSETWD